MMKRLRFLTGLVVLLFFCMSVLVPDAYAFSDLKNNHWAKRDIEYLVAKNIIRGYQDNTYRPNTGVTRGEFAVLLIKALNMEDVALTLKAADQLFRDVSSKHWAKGYIHLAWELGIVSGYADGSFRPNNTIRRDEMVSMLVRVLRYGGQGGKRVTFADEDQIPQWVKESVLQAAEWGLVSGFEDGTFRPAAQVTRAQAATFINNLLLQRGSQFDLYGKITGINLANRQLKVLYNGVEETFGLSANCQIYHYGQALSPAALGQGTSQYGLFVLNNQGQISFIDIVNSPVVGDTSLTLGPKIPAPPSGKESPGEQAGLVERELDGALASLTGSLERARKSLETTKAALGANRLSEDLGVNGSGQVIAVIDSGIDPGHPDLMQVPGGKEKLIDFLDLTGEGLVKTEETISAGNVATINGVSYNLGDIPSQSGIYHYGFFQESQIDFDVNFNGKSNDLFLVLVTDAKVKGQYDTVYIDTNNNTSLLDEKPLPLFGNSKERRSFSSFLPGKAFNFVLSELDSGGNFIKLGFDANGHGTQVAGVAAASGKFSGVAPGARLLVIKVLDRQGETSWDLLENAVRLAVEKGATVVNLSLGYYYDETSGNNSLTYLIDKLSKKRGVVFIAAAGNKGPGIGSLATPGNAKYAIGVGAYISPLMWKNDYGLEVEQDSLWYFSSTGPRPDGLVAPTVVGPGSGVTSSPLWSGAPYLLAEGTSIATPHLAGATALLLEAAKKQGVPAEPELVKKAITLGAKAMPQYTYAETGYGKANIYEAWRHLRRLESQAALKSYTWNRRLGIGEGIYAREFLPGLVPYRIQNLSNSAQILFWKANVDWLRPWFKMTALPQGSYRDVLLDYVLPSKPGLYTGILEGRFLNSYGPEVAMLTTLIKPYNLNQDNGYRMEMAETLGAAQLKRYFFRVPPGTQSLQGLLIVPKGAEGYKGRVRMHLIKPNGEEYMMSDFAGLAKENLTGREWVGTVIENPDPGTWEVVVYSSPSLSAFGLKESQYRLQVQLAGVPASAADSVNSRYLIGNVPKKLEPNKPNYISLSVRDKERKTPISDLMIEINGQVYQVKDGWVTFTVIPEGDKLELDVRL